MQLGVIQKKVVSYLSRCGEKGGYIGCTTTAVDFRGCDREQVELALAGLLRRGIIRRESIRYILVVKEASNEGVTYKARKAAPLF